MHGNVIMLTRFDAATNCRGGGSRVKDTLCPALICRCIPVLRTLFYSSFIKDVFKLSINSFKQLY